MQTATWVHIGYKLRGNVQISKSLPSNSALERRFNSLYGAGQAAEIAKQPGKATAYYQQLLKVCASGVRAGLKEQQFRRFDRQHSM